MQPELNWENPARCGGGGKPRPDSDLRDHRNASVQAALRISGQITNEVGAFELPRGFRTMQAAWRACCDRYGGLC